MLSTSPVPKDAAALRPDTLAMRALRRPLAALLLSVGGLMLRLSERLHPVRAHAANAAVVEEPHPLPRVEFHADGADGALYVDGKYVGRLPGVKRL
ncbi:hypothetical protein [Caldimonas brevitalea]|uniref:Uncharacterized protein n=1 Tax=Caldimonas brevitalea TaxID=413882 RepID=A0A0G3BL90_9BURK|nr:hypothetical protein [Caldimonas brevitalea]AKJ30229.1 hypothetical protein AAW51_3538 [Caldimonas brevitalea]